MQELIYYLSVHTTRKVKSEVIGQQRPASAVAAGLANRRRKIKHQPGVFDSRQTLSVRFAGSIDTVSNTAGCPPGVVLKAGCRTAALRLQMMHVSRPAQLDLMGPGCLVEPGVGESPPPPAAASSSSSSSLHLPSSDKPHYEREKVRKYPLLPPTPAAPRLWRGEA